MNRTCATVVLALLLAGLAGSQVSAQEGFAVPGSLINIRNTNGKFYAFVMLLFYENPHFVNMIQEDSIPVKMMQTAGFHVRLYSAYVQSLKDPALKNEAEQIFNLYLYPEKHGEPELRTLERQLEGRNIIARFSFQRGRSRDRLFMDYCIFGRKNAIDVQHPLFEIKEKIYNIQPLIYYDEFSTSNSTFYFDMIYINPEEVENDFLIARKVLAGEEVDNMFFVGSRVSDDIKFCLRRAFSNPALIRSGIREMFEIHELTHKILNNHYNFYDQVVNEEMALSSTIYANPYLGIAVMYSYLDYNSVNPHRIAALNYIRFIAQQSGDRRLIDNPSLVKDLPTNRLLQLTRDHFFALKRVLN